MESFTAEHELTLSGIYIYPVKSLGGISLLSSKAQSRGLQYDRRWMLVNKENSFLTQREFPCMALLGVRQAETGFEIFRKDSSEEFLEIPFAITEGETKNVQVWDDRCNAIHYSKRADEWLSEYLGTSCHLVYMPDDTLRKVTETYSATDTVSFADGFPYLIIGENALSALNARLEKQLTMDRFRPNLVFSGGHSFAEDTWRKFSIGEVSFEAVKSCARCVITTIDQETGISSAEPLKTLSAFRKEKHGVLFGQNVLLLKSGTIYIGDQLTVESKRE